MTRSMKYLDHAPLEYQGYFSSPREHYGLLQRLAQHQRGVVVDVGTLYGLSALALSSNPEVEVWSYDIVNHIPAEASIRSVPNISFRIKNGLDAVEDFVHKTDLIVLDIDPHDGVQEELFIRKLVDLGYTGRVLCDDIHLNDGMKAFWNGVTQRKEDLTDQGHWSGTGMIYFERD